MTTVQWIKILPFLPFVWFDSIRYRNKTREESYLKLQQWCRRILKILGYRLKIETKTTFEDSQSILFVSNHQGTLDPMLIIASSPVPMSFISKKENERLPIVGRWARNIETIHFDRETREGNIFMLREASRYLRASKHVLIFPEGTRSRGDTMNLFKQGALKPAYLGKSSIVPITLNHAYCMDTSSCKTRDLSIYYGNQIPYDEIKSMTQEDLTNWIYQSIDKKIKKDI